ncbi:MAG: HD domain-containing protein, partial [Gammaproteobacteria bacterium]|nr:HD domain-containing protein [Gammaproteobacteria bacterium]
LLDVMMPGMDGYAVMKRLRNNPLTRDIPVMFVTALDSVEDEESGLALGAVDYITKPLKPAIVLARVRTQIELKQVRDRLEAQKQSLELEVERRMGENHLIQDVSIHALARLAETRDKETGNHLRRTQAYVRTLARQLKTSPKFAHFLNDRTIDLMVKSAPLHDIGKVGIPDHILLKQGSLTEAEWEVMKTHTLLGSDAIEHAEQDAETPVEFLSLAKEITRSHHERWDGSGYPDGLSGETIPVSARLMAVADVFDALLCRRPYKAPMPPDEVRRLIVRESGHQFDPDIIEAFIAVFDELKTIAQRFSDPAPLDDRGTRDLGPPGGLN